MEQKIPLSRSQASPAQPVTISRTPLRPIPGAHEATDEAELLIALLAGFWLL